MTGWKAVERRVAKELGGERVGILGHEDVRHDRLSLEVKTRKALPKFLTASYSQAAKNARPGKVPVLILKQKHSLYSDSLVVLRLADFLKLFISLEAR